MFDSFDTIIESPTAPSHQIKRRFYLLYICLWLAAGTLIIRSGYLQLTQGTQWRDQAENNRVAITVVSAPRGIIYDAFHKQLVENVASTDLLIDPALLTKKDNDSILTDRLVKYLNLPSEQVSAAITTARSSQRMTLLARALDHDQVLQLQEDSHELQGIRLISSLVRKYPFEEATAHVLGYTSPVAADDLKKNSNLLPNDISGKTGIEKEYDQILHGTKGTASMEVNAAGQPQKEVNYTDPVPGTNLNLSLDVELQQYIYQLLQDRDDQRKEHNIKDHITGAVIAMDPRSGAIRALVSYPSFNANVFSQPGLRQNAGDLFQNERQPLFNRAIDGSYAPGSTIKPMLASAALEEGIINANTTVLSTGGITVGAWHFPDWKAGGHGVTDVTKAIAESVNTFFYIITGGDSTHTGLGVTRATDYLRKFGWGSPTGIDLPTEAKGFLPSPSWKETTKHEKWYIGDTYHLGIGQGDVSASPLQITAAISSIANGGIWYQPHIVESSQQPNQSTNKQHISSRRLPIRLQNLQLVMAGMRRTVTDGSGRSLASMSIPLAGKTGTAQVGDTNNNTHAWFISYGPFDSPQLVITVLLEKGGAGDAEAVPIAKNIWQWWIDHRYNK